MLENGLGFKVGRGFYEFTKTETIQAGKEVVLMDKKTGDRSAGSRRGAAGPARRGDDAAQADEPGEIRGLRPEHLGEPEAGRQTRFLYEVEDWSASS